MIITGFLIFLRSQIRIATVLSKSLAEYIVLADGYGITMLACNCSDECKGQYCRHLSH